METAIKSEKASRKMFALQCATQNRSQAINKIKQTKNSVFPGITNKVNASQRYLEAMEASSV